MDIDIDKINKTLYTHYRKNNFIKTAKLLFVVMTVLIIIFSTHISIYIFKEWAFYCYLCLYFIFSNDIYFKRSPLLGNILMAALASFIPLVILFLLKTVLLCFTIQELKYLFTYTLYFHF